MLFTGKYWSGTRKIFAVQANGINIGASTSTATCLSQSDINLSDALETVNKKLDSMNAKLENTQAFITKGPENVYKDIAIFARDILKCPICCSVTKDAVPHATSCCNNVFCTSCVTELVVREDSSCPLCKQRRGPLYPVLLSGFGELAKKVSVIPEELAQP